MKRRTCWKAVALVPCLTLLQTCVLHYFEKQSGNSLKVQHSAIVGSTDSISKYIPERKKNIYLHRNLDTNVHSSNIHNPNVHQLMNG